MSKFIFKNRFLIFISICLLFSANVAQAQTASISYQGKLNDGGVPANGQYDFVFKLYNQNGVQFSFDVPVNDVQVTNGIFTVLIPFDETPGIFLIGSRKFLEIAVRPGASTGTYTTLAPRQEFGSVPSAISARYASETFGAEFARNLLINGSMIPANQFVQTNDARLTDARNPLAGSANYIQNSTGSQSSSNFNISGTGSANTLNAATQYNLSGERVLNVTGQNTNIFLGLFNGSTTNTGFYNSFFGISTGRFITSGDSNTFIGFQVGEATTSGSLNTFIGGSAGVSNTTGSFNSLLGASANVESGNLKFAAAIGAFSRVSTDNTIVIGKVAGSYLNVQRPADTVQIPGTLNVSGNVGIGTNAPTEKLHVNGNVKVANGGIFIANPNTLVITSPNGACWGITVNNSGALATFLTACP